MKVTSFKPKLLDTLKNYSRSAFLHDLMAANGAEPSYHDASLFALSEELFLLMANHECGVSGSR